MKINKRGQMELSFGMIFSIILIIVFLSFAIYAIIKFLDFQDKIKITKFAGPKGDLQSDVTDVWNNYGNARSEEYYIPSKIKYVCFADFSYGARGANSGKLDELKRYSRSGQNLFFYPPEKTNGFESAKIEYLNMTQMTESENPYCIENKEGMIKLFIKKKFGENFVIITRD